MINNSLILQFDHFIKAMNISYYRTFLISYFSRNNLPKCLFELIEYYFNSFMFCQKNRLHHCKGQWKWCRLMISECSDRMTMELNNAIIKIFVAYFMLYFFVQKEQVSFVKHRLRDYFSKDISIVQVELLLLSSD